MVDVAIKKADVLIEALPYIREFQKKIFVIKYGGSILGEEKVRHSTLEDIAFLRYAGIRPLLVHGGGPNITERLKKLKMPSEFVDGMRVTDKQTLKVVEEELNRLNDLIVSEINQHGVLATPFKKETKLLQVVKKKGRKELGFVGDVCGFDEAALNQTLKSAIPVVVPMGVAGDGTFYNINADEVACFLASQLGAEKLVLLTKVLGVMRDPSNESSLIPTITEAEADELVRTSIVDAGMVPKLKAGLSAVAKGVAKAHIVDAKIPHALLLEIFTNKGIGTEIVK